MKQCPYCGSDLPNDKEIFCVKCSHIIDDDFLLRKEIKKELESMSPTKKKAKSKKNHTQPSVSNKRKNDGYVSVKYDEKKVICQCSFNRHCRDSPFIFVFKIII